MSVRGVRLAKDYGLSGVKTLNEHIFVGTFIIEDINTGVIPVDMVHVEDEMQKKNPLQGVVKNGNG